MSNKKNNLQCGIDTCDIGTMKLSLLSGHTIEDTLSAVERLSSAYMTDLEPYKNYSLPEFFAFVCKIPYEEDPPGIEFVMRPNALLARNKGDCDDKTTFFLAWAKLRKIPCGFSIVSSKLLKGYHHIFPFIVLDGIKIDCDATYSDGVLGRKRVFAWRKDFFCKEVK